ncbi:MAG: hypothetical protein ACLR6B_03685 [Blautia sp.]
MFSDLTFGQIVVIAIVLVAIFAGGRSGGNKRVISSMILVYALLLTIVAIVSSIDFSKYTFRREYKEVFCTVTTIMSHQ